MRERNPRLGWDACSQLGLLGLFLNTSESCVPTPWPPIFQDPDAAPVGATKGT